MTIDINLLRAEKGGQVELVRKSQESRGPGGRELVDKVIALDQEWRKANFELDEINKAINAAQAEVTKAFKAKEDASEKIKVKTNCEERKAQILEDKRNKEAELQKALNSIGNIVHEDVVVSDDEANNKVIRTWFNDGVEGATKRPLLSHNQVLARLGGYDAARGIKVAGHRGYFLKGPGVDLAFALSNYGLTFLAKREYTKIMTPFFMCKEMMAATAQLSQFDEELYKVVGDEADDKSTKYLIATSEQPISAFHADEWLPTSQLPLRYAGYSSCFRKEAGAHGKDTWGIFRVHQFEKVEQFVLCEPERSWDMFHEMISHSEDFYKSLGLSYRIVSIVSGALNNAAAMKYDLEAWFPFQGEFKELVSCSNCLDYQSRNLKIRCGAKSSEGQVRFVHLLNATLTAIERTICCILENWQTEDGLRIPSPLVPYIGCEFIPYTADLDGNPTTVMNHSSDADSTVITKTLENNLKL